MIIILVPIHSFIHPPERIKRWFFFWFTLTNAKPEWPEFCGTTILIVSMCLMMMKQISQPKTQQTNKKKVEEWEWITWLMMSRNGNKFYNGFSFDLIQFDVCVCVYECHWIWLQNFFFHFSLISFPLTCHHFIFFLKKILMVVKSEKKLSTYVDGKLNWIEFLHFHIWHFFQHTHTHYILINPSTREAKKMKWNFFAETHYRIDWIEKNNFHIYLFNM